MRLFAAVLPPPEVLRPLAEVVDALRELPGSDALRWTDRPGWHITLAFYGEVDDDTVPHLAAGLADVAARARPFELALGGGGRFGQGRTLWAGLRGDLHALRRLAGDCAQAGWEAGAPDPDGFELRGYRPHLSLARSRTPAGLEPHLAALDAFAGAPWKVTDLALVRSDLPRSGVPGDRPRYTPVAHRALGPVR